MKSKTDELNEEEGFEEEFTEDEETSFDETEEETMSEEMLGEELSSEDLIGDEGNPNRFFYYIGGGIIAFVILIFLLVAFINRPKEILILLSQEQQLKAAAEQYYNNNPEALPSTTRAREKVYLSDLIKGMYVAQIVDDKGNGCSEDLSYVDILNFGGGEFGYYPHLYCDNYVTKETLNDWTDWDFDEQYIAPERADLDQFEKVVLYNIMDADDNPGIPDDDGRYWEEWILLTAEELAAYEEEEEYDYEYKTEYRYQDESWKWRNEGGIDYAPGYSATAIKGFPTKDESSKQTESTYAIGAREYLGGEEGGLYYFEEDPATEGFEKDIDKKELLFSYNRRVTYAVCGADGYCTAEEASKLGEEYEKDISTKKNGVWSANLTEGSYKATEDYHVRQYVEGGTYGNYYDPEEAKQNLSGVCWHQDPGTAINWAGVKIEDYTIEVCDVVKGEREKITLTIEKVTYYDVVSLEIRTNSYYIHVQPEGLLTEKSIKVDSPGLWAGFTITDNDGPYTRWWVYTKDLENAADTINTVTTLMEEMNGSGTETEVPIVIDPEEPEPEVEEADPNEVLCLDNPGSGLEAVTMNTDASCRCSSSYWKVHNDTGDKGYYCQQFDASEIDDPCDERKTVYQDCLTICDDALCIDGRIKAIDPEDGVTKCYLKNSDSNSPVIAPDDSIARDLNITERIDRESGILPGCECGEGEAIRPVLSSSINAPTPTNVYFTNNAQNMKVGRDVWSVIATQEVKKMIDGCKVAASSIYGIGTPNYLEWYDPNNSDKSEEFVKPKIPASQIFGLQYCLAYGGGFDYKKTFGCDELCDQDFFSCEKVDTCNVPCPTEDDSTATCEKPIREGAYCQLQENKASGCPVIGQNDKTCTTMAEASAIQDPDDGSGGGAGGGSSEEEEEECEDKTYQKVCAITQEYLEGTNMEGGILNNIDNWFLVGEQPSGWIKTAYGNWYYQKTFAPDKNNENSFTNIEIDKIARATKDKPVQVKETLYRYFKADPNGELVESGWIKEPPSEMLQWNLIEQKYKYMYYKDNYIWYDDGNFQESSPGGAYDEVESRDVFKWYRSGSGVTRAYTPEAPAGYPIQVDGSQLTEWSLWSEEEAEDFSYRITEEQTWVRKVLKPVVEEDEEEEIEVVFLGGVLLGIPEEFNLLEDYVTKEELELMLDATIEDIDIGEIGIITDVEPDATPIDGELLPQKEAMRSSAMEYMKDREFKLPTKLNKSTKVYLDDLIKSEYSTAIYNDTQQVCDPKLSYVEVKKISSIEYDYYPYLFCSEVIEFNLDQSIAYKVVNLYRYRSRKGGTIIDASIDVKAESKEEE